MVKLGVLFKGISFIREHGFTKDRIKDLCRYTLGYYKSEVEGHEGWCYPTWLNNSGLDARLDGGKTGFFKNTLMGEKFHGIIKWGTRTVVKN